MINKNESLCILQNLYWLHFDAGSDNKHAAWGKSELLASSSYCEN